MEEGISIAPMMEMTDSHWRMMMRGITRKIVLYTEMVVDDTVNHTCNRSFDYFIGKNIEESPSVIQLSGHF
jgi:tRNA-dihydrouridine synthase A